MGRLTRCCDCSQPEPADNSKQGGNSMAAEREKFYVTSAKFASPDPLGLAGFALTTFVLNVHNAG